MKTDSNAVQRLKELAGSHVRYGYRRLTVLLKRERWKVNAKRIYRLYDEENLKVRSVERKKIARRQRLPQTQAVRPNDCWSADFVSEKLIDGRTIRILTVIDQYTRECVWLEADRSMNGPLRSPRSLMQLPSEEQLPTASHSTMAASSPAAPWKSGRFRPVSNCASFGPDGRWRTVSSRASTAGCETNVSMWNGFRLSARNESFRTEPGPGLAPPTANPSSAKRSTTDIIEPEARRFGSHVPPWYSLSHFLDTGQAGFHAASERKLMAGLQ